MVFGAENAFRKCARASRKASTSRPAGRLGLAFRQDARLTKPGKFFQNFFRKNRRRRPAPTPLFATPAGDFACSSLKTCLGTTSNHLKMPRSCRKIVGWDTFFGAEMLSENARASQKSEHLPPAGRLGPSFSSRCMTDETGKFFSEKNFSEKNCGGGGRSRPHFSRRDRRRRAHP